jgi:hypothetical protein
MKRKIFTTATMICCAMICFAAAVVDLNGKWEGSIKLPDGNVYPVNYEFTVNGDQLTGTAKAQGSPQNITAGKINGADLTFSVTDDDGKPILHSGKYYAEGDSVALTVNYRGAILHTTLKRAGQLKVDPVVVDAVVVDRTLSNFNRVQVAGPFEVYITQGSSESVQLKAPAEMISQVITEVHSGVLTIRNKHDNWFRPLKNLWGKKNQQQHLPKVEVFVTVKDLNRVKMSGSGSVSFKEGISANSLQLKTSGSGRIAGNINVKTVKSTISGSGTMKISGTAEQSTARISGSGNFSAYNLVTANAAVHVSGSGHATINASNKIDATTHGSASVAYTGDATIINSKKSGSGSIRRFTQQQPAAIKAQ